MPVKYDHNHDDRYYTQTTIDDILDDYSPELHTHDSRYYIKTESDEMIRWRPSRASEIDLPPYTENKDGDVILTRDNNVVWRWLEQDPNTGQGEWVQILSQDLYWLSPVDTVIDLPIEENRIGDVRLVFEDSQAYFWDGTKIRVKI